MFSLTRIEVRLGLNRFQNLLQSNALNLNRHTLGQLVNSNTATSRLVNEELLVSSVHFSEVGHIGQEDLRKKPRSVKRPLHNLCILLSPLPSWVQKHHNKKAGGETHTLTLTILSTLEPAAVRIALMLSQQTCVLAPMLPSIKLAEASAGIWPETKIWPLARMAWDCIGFVRWFFYSRMYVGVAW